jgi:hypothetical protein
LRYNHFLLRIICNGSGHELHEIQATVAGLRQNLGFQIALEGIFKLRPLKTLQCASVEFQVL